MKSFRRIALVATTVTILLSGDPSAFANPAPSRPAAQPPRAAPPVVKSRAVQLYDEGVRLVATKDYTRAATQFENAIAEKKDYAEAHNMLGYSYRNLGDYPRALTSYQTALKLRPDFAEAHEYIGEAYLGLNDLVHAMQHYVALQKLRSSEARELWVKIEAWVERQPRG